MISGKIIQLPEAQSTLFIQDILEHCHVAPQTLCKQENRNLWVCAAFHLGKKGIIWQNASHSDLCITMHKALFNYSQTEASGKSL